MTAAIAPAGYVIGFIVAFIAAVLLTPMVRDVAFTIGLVDPADGDRKLHTRPVPRVGGIALVLSLGIAFAALLVGPHPASFVTARPFVIVIVGGLAMHLLGVVDDLWQIRARYKLVGQLAIASAVCAAGLRVSEIALPGLPDVMLPPVVGAIITVLWLVGITNAFNLIDGVDGLASGAALVALLTMTAVGVVNQQWAATWVTLTLAGATLGLLLYNFHPASIFLGDSGSLFLGFMIAATGLVSSQKQSTALAVAVPILVLGLPLLDTTIAIARRFLRGQAIFAPDRGHIHHRLLSQGYSPRAVALLLCGISAGLGGSGLIMLKLPEFTMVVLVLLGLAAVLFVHRLRIHEFEELAGSMVRTATHRRSIERAVRAREAAAKMMEAADIETVFQTLKQTLPGMGFEAAEVNLRRDFAEHGSAIHVAGEDANDEVQTWSWGASDVGTSAWLLSIPLLSSRGEAIGSFRLWYKPDITEPSFSHWRAIAVHLCGQVSLKMEECWKTSVRVTPAMPPSAAARPVRNSTTRRANPFTAHP